MPKSSRREETTETASDIALPIRLTDQFRCKDSMMYDFKGDKLRLTLRICECAEGWEIEVIPKHLPDLRSITVTGPSRRDALGLLAKTWLGTAGFPWVDWPAIDDALTKVRAL